MNILMVCKGNYYAFMPAIADVLQKQYGHSVSAVTFATPTSRLKQMRAFARVYNLAAYLKSEVPRYDLDECVDYLQRLELSGEIRDLNVMVHADRIIRQHRFERVIKILTGICRFWQEVFRKSFTDAIVGEVACASEWIGWAFAQQRSVQYLIPYGGAIPGGFHFVRAPTGSWESAETVYREVKRRGLSADQFRIAEEFLATFRSRHIRASIHAPAFRSPLKLDVTTIQKLLHRAARIPFRVQTYLEDGNCEVGSYNGTPPWEPVLSDVLRILRHAVCEATMFERNIAAGKKIYFPLHVQPEFTIDVRAPFYTNQLALIENIAKSLPGGYRLIVKDHPGMRGCRTLEYYREMKKLYNVQLLSPSVDSHEIIKESEAVLTITGTTAWEGVLYEKPVVAFGPLGYGFFDLIYNCSAITDLPMILSVALRDFQPDRGLLLKFIWATLQTVHRAEWHDPFATPAILHPANIEAVAKSIEAEIQTKKIDANYVAAGV